MRSIFSNKFDETENKLVRSEVYSAAGILLRSTDHAYATTGNGTNPYPWPQHVGSDKRQRVNSLTVGQWAPERQTVITQDGATFTKAVTSFDSYARSTNVTRSSSVGYSVTESTSYADNTTLWVMGQVQGISVGALAPVVNTYDSSTAVLTSSTKFGVLQGAYEYYSDGNLKKNTDGLGHATTYANWYRGLPQSASYPTGATKSIVVDERGWIASVTDEVGYTTAYAYDAMGRLASISPPGGFMSTTVAFTPVGSAEFDLPAGHWRQTLTKGNAKTVTYFDGWWRPVMTRTYDLGDEAGTRKVVIKAFDHNNKPTFESYPQRDIASVNTASPGKRNQYDALGRSTRVDADSELGVLSTVFEYLTGFQTRTTNPRNYVSTQNFWVLDDPNSAQLAGMAAPEGVALSIVRDVFGKPVSITRAGGGKSVSRYYVYESGQRLCKTVEPEVGATVQVYDAAGNIAWRAPGQNLVGTTTCDDASVPAAGRISYGYDGLNRLTSTMYGDGSPGVSRTYKLDGMPETILSNGSTWTYDYNALRQLTTEIFNYGGINYSFVRGYNSAGDLSTLTYPSTVSVAYNPNALGEPTTVGGYSSSVAFHPNGAVSSYVLGNSITHTLSLNVRGLPDVNADAGVVSDRYTYDANGNISAIIDQQEGVTTRSMTYDGLDRIITANAPNVWGSADYGYDALDNLTSANVGSRNAVLSYDASNRLTGLNINGGVSAITYDARGNAQSKGSQTYNFDLGNRMSSSSLGGSFSYDGDGRRFKIQSADGSTRLSLYSKGGQLLWSTSTGGSSPASSTAYIYLGTHQIAEWNSVNGLQYVHVDALGSPIAHTSTSAALISRTRYEPYGAIASGMKPSPSTSQVGFTGHVQDAESDLVYMQQRYFDPILGRFLSVDPIVTDANTGKGFGLYTYVENNPYAKIDPDGRELVALGSAEFKKSINEQLKQLESTPTGKALVDSLREDKHLFVIKEGFGESKAVSDNGPNARNGVGSGGVVTHDPTATPDVQTTAGKQPTPAFVVLGHELAHAQDMAKGRISDDKSILNPKTKTPVREERAVKVENAIRRESKIPERTEYGNGL